MLLIFILNTVYPKFSLNHLVDYKFTTDLFVQGKGQHLPEVQKANFNFFHVSFLVTTSNYICDK